MDELPGASALRGVTRGWERPLSARSPGRRSGTDEFDVSARRRNQALEVDTVHGEDVVSVRREQHDRRVDDVGQTGGAQQLTGRPPERLIERPHIDTVKGL